MHSALSNVGRSHEIDPLRIEAVYTIAKNFPCIRYVFKCDDLMTGNIVLSTWVHWSSVL